MGYFDKAVQLYELAYQSHLDFAQQQQREQQQQHGSVVDDCSSLRLAIIISNNLGQIHRITGDANKHEQCLHHLLAAIVYVVECRLVGSVLNQTEFDGLYKNVSTLM